MINDESSFNWNGRREQQMLHELRQFFLHTDGKGTPDYWSSPELLALYDATLARRIAWKWDAVLGEITKRGLWNHMQACSAIVDWGTGSGVAVERLLQAWPHTSPIPEVELRDRSTKALQFSSGKIQKLHVGLRVSATTDVFAPVPPNSLLLVSHVLSELQPEVRQKLVAIAKQGTAVIWVEAGTHFVSRRLIEVREQVRPNLLPVAPCLHTRSCGLLATGRERDWCHSFAKPPGEVFTDGNWARLARELKIDLRSLPVSFLVAVHDSHGARAESSRMAQVLGRARILKGCAKVQLCSAAGISDVTIAAKTQRELYGQLDSDSDLFCCQIPDFAPK